MAPAKVDSYASNTERNWHNKGHSPIPMPSLKKITFDWYAILPGAVKMASIRDPLYIDLMPYTSTCTSIDASSLPTCQKQLPCFPRTVFVWPFLLKIFLLVSLLHDIFNFVVSSLYHLPPCLCPTFLLPGIPGLLASRKTMLQAKFWFCLFHIRHHHVYGQTLVKNALIHDFFGINENM